MADVSSQPQMPCESPHAHWMVRQWALKRMHVSLQAEAQTQPSTAVPGVCNQMHRDGWCWCLSSHLPDSVAPHAMSLVTRTLPKCSSTQPRPRPPATRFVVASVSFARERHTQRRTSGTASEMSASAVCNFCGAKGKLKVRSHVGGPMSHARPTSLFWLTDGQCHGGRQLCTVCRSVGYCR